MYAQILSQIRDQSELLFATQRFNATQNVFVGRRHTLFSWLHCTNSAPIAPLTQSTVNGALFRFLGPFIHMDIHDPEKDKALFGKYPLWTLLMVKAAKKALDEKRARIEDGFLIVDPPSSAPVARPRLTRTRADQQSRIRLL